MYRIHLDCNWDSISDAEWHTITDWFQLKQIFGVAFKARVNQPILTQVVFHNSVPQGNSRGQNAPVKTP